VKGEFGKRVLGPALIPLGAFAFIGVLVFSFSRVLLAVPKDGSIIVAVLMAGSILLGAGALSKGAAIKAPQRAALIAFGVFILGGGVAAALSIGTRPVEQHLQVAATIAAQNIKFDRRELDLPADKAFILEFDNKDSVAHNVAIYQDQAAANSQAPAGTLFKGEIFPGPKVMSYEIKNPIPKGVYYFRCDVHSSMNGVAKVGGATGPAPAPPGPGPTGSAAGPSSPAPGPGSPSPVTSSPPGAGTTVALTAKNIEFDKKSLTFVANAPVVINFDNQDANQLHNFALYSDAAYTNQLFAGPFVTGPAKTKYEFPAPGPGTYYFQCNVHPIPAMRGTVTVT